VIVESPAKAKTIEGFLGKDFKVSEIKEEPKKTKKQSKLSYKEQQDHDNLPEEIEALESKISEINSCLYDPKCYEEKGLTILTEELATLEAEYEEKTERYLEVLELFESL